MLKRALISIFILGLLSYIVMQGVKLNTMYLVKYKVFSQNDSIIDAQILRGQYDVQERIGMQYDCDSLYIISVTKVK